MKKIFTFIAALVYAAGMFAASYGILVNGKTYFAGEKVDEFEGFQQYLAHVQVSNGDKLQLCDAENKAVWAVDLNTASVAGFTRDGDHYNVTVTGCYDFYIKLKYEADELYIGNGSNCGEGIDISGGQGGGDNPGGQGGGTDEDVNYYAIGWINGADHGEAAYDKFEDEYMFENGKLTINCQMGSYICIKDHLGNFYRSKTPTTIQDTQVTLDWQNGWSGGEKWAIPEGVNYIIIREATCKGQIKLERVDKATYDAYSWGGSQGVENVQTSEKAHKVMMDGQLYIMYKGTKYNVQGAEVK